MTSLAFVAALVVGALLVTRISGFAMRRMVRRIAERSDATGRWWRAGASRSGLESAAATEQRRRQRIDAAARMLNHVVTLVVWIGVTIAVFHLFDIDAAFFLSSAGFLGAGVAIGGQHKVSDYLTGLSVLFEDRYGVGDELVVDVGSGAQVHAVVDNIGLLTTRLRDETSTLHVPNAQLSVVRNLSQEASSSTVRLRVPEGDGLDATRRAAEALRNVAGSEQLTASCSSAIWRRSARTTAASMSPSRRCDRWTSARGHCSSNGQNECSAMWAERVVERLSGELGPDERGRGQTASRVRARAAR